jgi:hypothetical protein
LEIIRNDYEKDKHLMKTLNKTILAVLVSGLISCALFGQQAQAVPMVQVSGHITFAGTVTLNTTSAATATAVVAGGWHGAAGTGNPEVMSRDGDFATFVANGAPVTFTALQWNFNSGAIPSFWAVGGFTFNLTSSVITSQGGIPGVSGFVTVGGSGFVSGNGFASTFGTWSFSTQDPAAGNPPVFSFSASSGTVPDSGSTVALLGLALAGVEALRRKMSR